MDSLITAGLLLARSLRYETPERYGSAGSRLCKPASIYNDGDHNLAAGHPFRHGKDITGIFNNAFCGEPVEEQYFAYACASKDNMLQQSCLLAQAHMPILICGESGTGKSLFARHIVRKGGFTGKVYEFTCSTLQPAILEDICKTLLPGTEEAVPGAQPALVILKEVQSLPLGLQKLLIRAIRAKIMPKSKTQGGAEGPFVIASMNVCSRKSLPEQGVLHELAAAFGLGCITIPPLRERREDILPLSDFFLEKYKYLSGGVSSSLNRSAHDTLMAHSWPGNVRMLETVLLRSLVLQEEKKELRTLFFSDPH